MGKVRRAFVLGPPGGHWRTCACDLPVGSIDPKETFVAHNRTAGKTYTGHSWPSPSAGSDPSAPPSESCRFLLSRKRAAARAHCAIWRRARLRAEGLRTPRSRAVSWTDLGSTECSERRSDFGDVDDRLGKGLWG